MSIRVPVARILSRPRWGTAERFVESRFVGWEYRLFHWKHRLSHWIYSLIAWGYRLSHWIYGLVAWRYRLSRRIYGLIARGYRLSRWIYRLINWTRKLINGKHRLFERELGHFQWKRRVILRDLPLKTTPHVVKVIQRQLEVLLAYQGQLVVFAVELDRGVRVFDGVMDLRLDVDSWVEKKYIYNSTEVEIQPLNRFPDSSVSSQIRTTSWCE